MEYWKTLKDGSHLQVVIDSSLHPNLNQSTVNVKVFHKPADKLDWEGYNYFASRTYNGKPRRYLSYTAYYEKPAITLSIDATNYDWSRKEGTSITEGLYRYYQLFQANGLLFDKNSTITHNDDGKKTITVNVKITNANEKVDEFSISYRLTDNQAQSNAVISGEALGSPISIVINRNSTAALHKLYWSFGNMSGTISTNATTSATWTPDIAQLAPQIPNLTSGKVKIRLETYIDNRKIGERIYERILSLPANIKPTLGGLTLLDGNQKASALNLGTGNFVQTQSNIRPRFDNANGINGSTIVSYRAELQRYVNGKWEATSLSTNTNNGLMGNANFSGRARVVAYVTDSRGRRSDSRTVELTYLPYHVPALSFRGDRTGSGNDRINVTRNIKIAPLTVNNRQKNTGRLTFDVIDVQTNQRTNGVGGSADWVGTTEHEKINWMATLNGTYDVGRTYVVIGQLADAFNTVTFEYRVGVEAVPVSISKYGLSIGKEWARGVLDVGGSEHLPAYFDCDIIVREKPIQMHALTSGNARLGYAKFGVDCDTTYDSGMYWTNANAPGNDFGCLSVTRMSEKEVQQTFVQRNGDRLFFRYRHYQTGVWTNWVEYATKSTVGNQKHRLTADDGNAIVATGDWNNYLATGFYIGLSLTNEPKFNGMLTGKYVRVTRFSESFVLQEAIDIAGNVSCYRVKNNGTWQLWKQYAMASIASSWTSTGVTGVDYKVNGDIVSLRINIASLPSGTTSLGNIPSQYLPVKNAEARFQLASTQLVISANGAINTQYGTSGLAVRTQVTWQI